MAAPTIREGSLEAPTRHPIDWRSERFYDEESLFREMERVFDICHGCRRCTSLCQAFPTLFDLVDTSESMEIDGVARRDYWQVVDNCYLCDLCYMTKCPYVPPHTWDLDFPHLMLRAKAFKFKQGRTKLRDTLLTSTDLVGSLAGIPVVSDAVNAANRSRLGRRVLESVLEVHRDACVPHYRSQSLRKCEKARIGRQATGEAAGKTKGKVALFATCYGNYNEPGANADLIAVFEHNGIPVALPSQERCCGMPKLELGDLAAVQAAKEANIPILKALIDDGWDLCSLIPSCVLMFKQELPLLFPDDPDVLAVKAAFFDPFEYLMIRHKHGKLDLDFKNPLGTVAYQVSCHQRVQNIGLKTRDVLALVPGTAVEAIERCSGHDGTYGVKKESYAAAMKIVRPVADRIKKAAPEHFGSDCPMAGAHIAHALGEDGRQRHPISLLRLAYGL